MKAGAKLNFGKAEVYWPQDDKASDKYQTLLGIKATPEAQSPELVQPTFDLKVKIDARVDVLVTPEVSVLYFIPSLIVFSLFLPFISLAIGLQS